MIPKPILSDNVIIMYQTSVCTQEERIACNLGKANLADSWTFAYYTYTTARQTTVRWSLIHLTLLIIR